MIDARFIIVLIAIPLTYAALLHAILFVWWLHDLYIAFKMRNMEQMKRVEFLQERYGVHWRDKAEN